MKKYLCTLIFITCLPLLIGCGGKSAGNRESSDYCTIATLKGPSALGMIKMIDSIKYHDRLYTENGVKKGITIVILNEPLQVRKMMIDGTADFAILPMTTAAVLYNKGLDYKLAAVPIWGTFYLCGKDSTIKNWSNLRGRRIHLMAKGMTPDVLFRYLLKQNGLDPDKDVKLDYSFPTHTALTSAMAAGRVDIGVLTEPFVSMVLSKNKSLHALLDLNAEWKKACGTPIAETAFVGNGKFMKNHPELTGKILRIYSKSTDWVNNNPDSAAFLTAKYGILADSTVARVAIPRCNLKFVKASEVRKEVNDYLKIFYNMNPDITGGKIPDEKFYMSADKQLK
jgi:NitT/TauT family transport system substrate-binding protein